MSGARVLAARVAFANLAFAVALTALTPAVSQARPTSPRASEAARLSRLVREALLQAVPYPQGKVSVRELRVPAVRGSERYVRASVELRAAERYRGQTSFAVRLEGDGDVEPLRVWGTASLRVRVPVLVAVRDLRVGHTVAAADVERVERFLDAHQEAGAGSLEDVVGHTVRRPMRAFSVVRTSELRKPTLVRRGALVQLVVRLGGLVAVARGRALGEGARGDSVSVESLGSGKKVVGRIDGRGRVTVEF